jgi:hypothetical protein
MQVVHCESEIPGWLPCGDDMVGELAASGRPGKEFTATHLSSYNVLGRSEGYPS